MKAMLQFDMNEQEDREAHLRATKSLDLALTLWDISQMLRSMTKHTPTGIDYDTADKIREEFYKIMDDHGIILDELMS